MSFLYDVFFCSLCARRSPRMKNSNANRMKKKNNNLFLIQFTSRERKCVCKELLDAIVWVDSWHFFLFFYSFWSSAHHSIHTAVVLLTLILACASNWCVYLYMSVLMRMCVCVCVRESLATEHFGHFRYAPLKWKRKWNDDEQHATIWSIHWDFRLQRKQPTETDGLAWKSR